MINWLDLGVFGYRTLLSHNAVCKGEVGAIHKWRTVIAAPGTFNHTKQKDVV